MKRRQFIQGLAGGTAALMLPSCGSLAAADRPALAEAMPLSIDPVSRSTWLGEAFWANRLQDWQLADGQIECTNGQPTFEMRTAHILTHDLADDHAPARIRATVTAVEIADSGFGGFLIGVGGGELDYRKAALVQRASGRNGGLLAVVDAKGELSFRDFTDSAKPLAFDRYALDETVASPGLAALVKSGGAVVLDCHIDPVGADRFDIRLIATDAGTGEEVGFIVKTDLPGSLFCGGIALVSSPQGEGRSARFGFRDIALGGAKIDAHPDRAIGPVMGALFSLNQTVLKLTAQFMPVDVAQWPSARLDYRASSASDWTAGPVAEVGHGFAALFRIEDWNANADHDYRIVHPDRPDAPVFTGRVKRDPGGSRPLRVALHSCLLPTSRSIDQQGYKPANSLEENYDRYSEKSLVFPHTELVTHCESHDPDLYVFLGDQYYETFPTRYGRDTEQAELDTLYRWYLWFWTFRDVTRDMPCIMLADDHDVLQGNLWGRGGDGSGGPTEEDGGYKWDKALIRMVYRIQCGHNPDPYDRTPILHDIPVSYGHFVYGGTSFAFVEDRKWKTPPNPDIPTTETSGDLLGERQEAFLDAWAEMDPGLPKVCLTASIWGSPQTDTNLVPLVDYDSNGYPPDGRTRAVKLLRKANAVAIAGDQHLGVLSRQGVDDYEDGPFFFAGPAGSAFWQRWFEGEGRLENDYEGGVNSGNFVDCFGNKMRVFAVANPKMTHAEFKAANESWGNFVGDRDLKSEGYGIVVIDHADEAFTFECWPWDADPATQEQFEGWPFRLPFSKAGSGV